VISDRLWRRRFAADPSVVGKPITLNGHPFTVIGVAAPEFTGLLFRAISSDLWAPAMMMGQLRTNQLANRGERWMFVKARLARGATVERAAQMLSGLGARLAASYPETNRGRTFATRRTTDVMVNPDGDRVVFPAALALLVAVGFVVLIASTNVGNLMFARAAPAQESRFVSRQRAPAARPTADQRFSRGDRRAWGLSGVCVRPAVDRVSPPTRPDFARGELTDVSCCSPCVTALAAASGFNPRFNVAPS
jgi:hypothetical protein